MSKYLLAFISVLLTSGAQIMLKRGSSVLLNSNGASLWTQVWRIAGNPFIIGGISLYGISTLVWLFVLSKMKLSIAYPLVSLSYVIVMIASYYLLGETIMLNQKIALLLIVLGVILLVR